MKSVHAFLFVLAFSATLLAGCAGSTVDDTAMPADGNNTVVEDAGTMEKTDDSVVKSDDTVMEKTDDTSVEADDAAVMEEDDSTK